MPRTILHADMDAFYASIEQRDDASLRGKPVIVGGLGRRGVVSTASYEARTFGVRSAMPTAEAHRRCPDGIFVPPRMAAYAAESEKVQAVFARYTPPSFPKTISLELPGRYSAMWWSEWTPFTVVQLAPASFETANPCPPSQIRLALLGSTLKAKLYHA